MKFASTTDPCILTSPFLHASGALFKNLLQDLCWDVSGVESLELMALSSGFRV